MATLRISIAECDVDYDDRRALKNQTRLWAPPKYIGFQAPVPPPPDYSTPAKVNARIAEFCGHSFLHKAAGDKSFGKVLKAFRAQVPAQACAVEDWHVSRWEIVEGCTLQGSEDHECKRGGYYQTRSTCIEGLTLRLRKIETPKPAPKPRRPRGASWLIGQANRGEVA